jgi:hypothetical protein
MKRRMAHPQKGGLYYDVNGKTLGAVAGVGGIALAIMFSSSSRAQSRSDSNEQALVQIGFQIAPVPLNLTGKNHDLVRLGRYLVNAVGDCNGCHTAGGTRTSITLLVTTLTFFSNGRRKPTRVLIWQEARTSDRPSPWFLGNRIWRLSRARHHHPQLDAEQRRVA